MERRVSSPTWGPPPPCKQVLREELINDSNCIGLPHGKYVNHVVNRKFYLRISIVILIFLPCFK